MQHDQYFMPEMGGTITVASRLPALFKRYEIVTFVENRHPRVEPALRVFLGGVARVPELAAAVFARLPHRHRLRRRRLLLARGGGRRQGVLLQPGQQGLGQDRLEPGQGGLVHLGALEGGGGDGAAGLLLPPGGGGLRLRVGLAQVARDVLRLLGLDPGVLADRAAGEVEELGEVGGLAVAARPALVRVVEVGCPRVVQALA